MVRYIDAIPPKLMRPFFADRTADNVDDVLPIFDQSNADAWRAYLLQITGNQRHFFISPSLYRARTTGTVRLATRSAADDPLIDPDYFNDRNDLMAMVRGMSMCLKIVESDAFRPYSRYVEHGLPGCKLCRDRPLSECYTYLACAIQTYTINSFHPCCTTRMGNASNPLAVVDARLRVLGVQRLRVVDASVMPVVPNANINAATFMLGERGSDLIRADNQLG